MPAAWLHKPAYLLSVTVLLMTLAASSSPKVNSNGVLVCSQAGFYTVSFAPDGSAKAGSYCPMCVSSGFVFLPQPQVSFGKRLAASYHAWQRLAALPFAVTSFVIGPFTRAPPWLNAL